MTELARLSRQERAARPGCGADRPDRSFMRRRPAQAEALAE
jgi:hypothetical protein